MPTYNVDGFIWSGLGTANTLAPVSINDDDGTMSPYFTNDFGETITIGGTTYINPKGGTYKLTFTDSGGITHTEDLLLWSTGPDFIFVPLPGSNFDSGSTITSLGGWQNWTTGFTWTDVVCFTKGTEIATPTGARLIETLSIGDLVITRDNGLQPIKWIGQKFITGARQYAFPHLRPIKIKKDALGANTPQKDIWLSPQHRIHHKSHQSAVQFGSYEVLIPAKGMINDSTILTDNSMNSVAYIHILFERHEIVFADGLACESFHPGAIGIDAMEDAARAELFDIFPDLQCNPNGYGPSARQSLSVSETQHIFKAN
ncbi:MAG: Hint domain-containing protein [Amylibacter sp.]|nr:Hint domain-containing protein [Amylibacter sp.]